MKREIQRFVEYRFHMRTHNFFFGSHSCQDEKKTTYFVHFFNLLTHWGGGGETDLSGLRTTPTLAGSSFVGTSKAELFQKITFTCHSIQGQFLSYQMMNFT